MSIEDRINEILDNVNKYGMDNLSFPEKIFLDNYSNDLLNNSNPSKNKNIFKDGKGYFIFKHNETIVFEDETRFNGILFTPNLYINEVVIQGELEGDIVLFDDGGIFPNMSANEVDKDGNPYDIFEFSYNLNKELYKFMSFIINNCDI